MEIINKKLKEIKPYEKNPRKNNEAVKYVANSIKEFGFKVPIVIDSTGTIICGHTRYKAAKQLKLKEVPCIIADDLTEEQIKAFRLADNKVSEFAEWDFDFLNEELENIIDINMEDFGFKDFSENIEEILEENTNDSEIIDEKVERNIVKHNENFYTYGKYDIPIIKPVYELPEIKEWISFNYVLSDENPEGKAVHFFLDDYQFERIFFNPEKYIEKLKKYVCVASPDFSPYSDYPAACQIYNHYRKHYVAAYLQNEGITVIPTIRASRDERSLEWFLDGEPHNSIVIISSMYCNDEESVDYFKNKEFKRMKERLNPNKIFLYGRNFEDLGENIEYIPSYAEKNLWRLK